MNKFIAIALAVIIALIVCLILRNQMKSVAQKQDMKDYLKGNLHLTKQDDVYVRTTETRTKIEKDNKK